ncbi:hypothetical protein PENSPDRAFT_658094 [Peniophora sp. CONT]|nr:hypothetical protein PENSPDRAFT_658094 [Peniophora sp. CONT]
MFAFRAARVATPHASTFSLAQRAYGTIAFSRATADALRERPAAYGRPFSLS